jgi:hypothetical protein
VAASTIACGGSFSGCQTRGGISPVSNTMSRAMNPSLMASGVSACLKCSGAVVARSETHG